MSAQPVAVPELTTRQLERMPWSARDRYLRALAIVERPVEDMRPDRRVRQPGPLLDVPEEVRKAASAAYERWRQGRGPALSDEQNEALRAHWQILRRARAARRKGEA